MQEAQAPSGEVPQYLIVSEIQRRTEMRKRYQEQQQPQGTVADQIVQEAAGGIASMPPQGMPPQGMPPQGAPQQAMPPQAMPPQQMFSGGIIRLQEGGSTSMPGAGALEPIMYAIQEKAKDIARITGRKFEEVYEILLRQAQEQNPDYSMIAPAGLGVSMDDLLSLPEGAGSNVPEMFQSGRDANTQLASLPDPSRAYQTLLRQAQENMPDYSMIAPAGLGISMDDLPSLPEGAGSNFPEMFQSGRDVNAQLASLPSLPEGAGSNIPEMFQSGRDTNTQLASLPSLPDLGQTDVALPDKRRGEGIASARESYVPNLPDLGLGSLFDVIFGVPERPDYEVAGEVATYRPFDAKPANVQGESPIQTQAVSRQGGGDPVLTNILNSEMVDPYMPDRVLGNAPVKEDLAQEDAPDALKDALDLLTTTAGPDASNPKREPSLDFSDLVADAKKAGMANALMQLGAGIAGGDLSKGISAAGVAATKGQQAAKDLAIKQRLATYAAGREDQAREEKAEEFKKTFGLSERKVNALIEQNADTTQREILRTLVSLYEGESNLDKKAGYARQIQDMLREIQGLPVNYGPTQGFDNNDPVGIRS